MTGFDFEMRKIALDKDDIGNTIMPPLNIIRMEGRHDIMSKTEARSWIKVIESLMEGLA